jgi:membrane protease YdiL (CAAX protease family)
VFAAALILVLVAWNVLANTVAPGAQLPISVLGAFGLLLIARRAGLDWSDLGLARRNLGDGVRVGVIAAGAVILVLVTAAAIPDTRNVLADGRFVGMDLPRALYEMLVRIPLAVALAEEIAFRGVLLGFLMTRTTAVRAVVISSALFGLWHVFPAIAALESSSVVEISSTGVQVGLVAVQVLVTGLAGGVFSWLRLRGGHVASSILVHAPLNSVSFGIGWLAVQGALF